MAHLTYTSPSRRRPQRGKLFCAKLDLELFAMSATSYLKGQRCSLALFSKTDLSACRFCCQVTLRDWIMAAALQFLRQPLDQKFAFNFPILSRPIVHSHKAEILNATALVSRFSRGQKIL